MLLLTPTFVLASPLGKQAQSNLNINTMCRMVLLRTDYLTRILIIKLQHFKTKLYKKRHLQIDI